MKNPFSLPAFICIFCSISFNICFSFSLFEIGVYCHHGRRIKRIECWERCLCTALKCNKKQTYLVRWQRPWLCGWSMACDIILLAVKSDCGGWRKSSNDKNINTLLRTETPMENRKSMGGNTLVWTLCWWRHLVKIKMNYDDHNIGNDYMMMMKMKKEIVSSGKSRADPLYTRNINRILIALHIQWLKRFTTLTVRRYRRWGFW